MSIFSFSSMQDVITIGAATRDVFLVSDQFFTMKTTSATTGIAECVSLGSKIDVKTFYATTGGGATNAAVTFRSLGYKTSIVCRIGDDETGNDVVNDLKKGGVDCQNIIKIAGGQTAYSTLLTLPEGERTVLVFRGVSAQFQEKDLDWKALKKTKWIYLTSLGGNLELSKKILTFAHKHQIQVAWNPGTNELIKGWKHISPLLNDVHVFIINKEEATLLTNESDRRKQHRLLQKENMIRLITDGSKGTDVLNGSKLFHVKTSGVKVISKTGAGDAFGSGFVAALIKYHDPIIAAKVGTLNAESVIQHLGAKKGIIAAWPSESKMKKIKIV